MQEIDLAGEWRLVRDETREAIPARVPGDTYSALFAAGKIPDPYAGTNELEIQWVGREDWIYERCFSIGDGFLAEEEIVLSCDSLDTIADIFLNGRKVGSSDNMFVRRRFDAKPYLTNGLNEIQVRFKSAENVAALRAKALPYPIPHTQSPVQSPHRNLVRKVQCHAGWDWGPCLMVAGVSGDICLLAYSDVRIDYVLTEQKHSAGLCAVTVRVESRAARAGHCSLRADLGGHAASRAVELDKGFNTSDVEISIKNPSLWWPNGHGEQPLYELTVQLGGDIVSRRIGLRSLELVTAEEAQGLSMVFRVNKRDIFCKGANWIPHDALPQRESRRRLEHLLGSAAAAHMNMIRVWGGGKYESEDFYSICDEKGLLVWQDMMFSCALYPAAPEFLASVAEEVRHQVKRLRDHPCIALWCGNNEDLGALTWFPESQKNRDRYLVDYDRLNEGTIGRVVEECDPTRAFWPSSPSAGRGDYSDNWHDDRRGDMHFWRVWHEGKPFSAFLDTTPRFCSEFGFQSFPSINTIRAYADERDFNVASPVMEHHQRHPRGNSIITEMFTRYFRIPQGFENFVYLSQVQQALAIRTAVEHWRRLRPHCMGTLYWQLNDTWPVCSWSSIDYSGTWKLLHYVAKRFYAPVLLSAYLARDTLEVWITNDLAEEVRAVATVTVLDFHGNELCKKRLQAQSAAECSRHLKGWRLSELAGSPGKAFVLLGLNDDRTETADEVFLTEPKRCELADSRVTVDCRDTDKGYSVTVSADKPAFFVSLFTPGLYGEFSDNCFTLLPASPRVVTFRPRGPTTLQDFRRALCVKHLRQTY
jgi:beta-mannosidase